MEEGQWLTGGQIEAQLLTRGFIFDRAIALTGYPRGVILQFKNIAG